MGCMKTFVLVLSLAVIGLSIYLYTPLPDDVPEPWKVRSVLAVSKFIRLLCKVSDMTGYDSCINITRSCERLFTPSPASKSDPLLKVTDTTFGGTKVRMYRPKDAPTPTPALVFFHGGGWTTGSIDTSDAFTAAIAKSANIVVVSVHYRLAPEYPFPYPFEDCVSATLHLLQNYEKYGVHGQKIAVGGEGTGGNLAAAIAKRFSAESSSFIQRLKFQVLIYPALQAFDFNLPSYAQFQDVQTLTKTEMIKQWIHYIGLKDVEDHIDDFSINNHTSMILKYSEYAAGVSQTLLPERFQNGTSEIVNKNEGNDRLSYRIEVTLLDPHLSPLMAMNLTQVPQAYIMTADFDVLRDEGLIYAERLRKDGVRVNTYHMKLSAHGFCSYYYTYAFTQLDMCNKAIKEIVHYIEENVD